MNRIASIKTSFATRCLSYNERTSAQALDALSVAALLYLAVPTFAFLAGWLIWPAAAMLTGLLAWSIKASIPWNHLAQPSAHSRPAFWTIVAVAAAWSALGGAGHFVFANPDWQVRDAVFGDLIFGQWPPSYGVKDGSDLILRSAIGYFLPAAVIAKALGIHAADIALYGWTAGGCALFLLLLPLPSRFGTYLFAALATIVFFSGMDIVGALIKTGYWPIFPGRIEWWTAFSYSSLAGQLLWAPNHALPIWLATALFYRHWRHTDFPQFACILLPLLPLWTPFALPALFPFFLLAFFNHLKTRGMANIPFAALLNAALLIYLAFRYLTLSIGGIALGADANNVPALAKGDFLPDYLLFVIVEFAALALALGARLQDSLGLLAIAMAMLCALPLLSFGPSNDLLLRASIPSIVILLILTLKVFQHWTESKPEVPFPWLIGAILVIGTLTPFHEMARALMWRRIPANYAPSLTEQQNGFPPHYIASLNRIDLILIFKAPSPVPSSQERRSLH